MPEISKSVDYKFAVRFFTTTLSGIVIYTGHHETLLIPKVFDIFLTYLGDISYSFYLVHWPIIVFGRYSNTDSTIYGLIYIAISCIIIAILLYEILDKVVPNKSTYVIYIQTGVIFVGIMFICFNDLSSKLNYIHQKVAS